MVLIAQNSRMMGKIMLNRPLKRATADACAERWTLFPTVVVVTQQSAQLSAQILNRASFPTEERTTKHVSTNHCRDASYLGNVSLGHACLPAQLHHSVDTLRRLWFRTIVGTDVRMPVAQMLTQDHDIKQEE